MLRVHFLNVGHGDCTIIAHPSGRITMIDINNSQEYNKNTYDALVEERNTVARTSQILGAVGISATQGNPLTGSNSVLETYFQAIADAEAIQKRETTNPIEFMKNNYPGKSIWRFILTHPDLDHMRGLKRVYEEIGFHNLWDTNNVKEISKFKGNSDREDWEFYQKIRSGGVSDVSVRKYTRGNAMYAFAANEDGSAGGDNIEILSPTPDLVASSNVTDDWNEMSIVIRVTHAGRGVLLPGDAESAAWDSMEGYYGATLKSDFLKASHHGRDSAYHSGTMKLIAPIGTFVSVGKKPSTDAHSKYSQQSQKVASTRFYGDMELRIEDSGSATCYLQHNVDKW